MVKNPTLTFDKIAEITDKIIGASLEDGEYHLFIPDEEAKEGIESGLFIIENGELKLA